MPVTHPLRKPDGQRLWAVWTKACKRLKAAVRFGSRAPRGRRRGHEKSRPPGRLLLVSTDLSANQPPTFSAPFIMAQWPGKEQKNA